MSRIEFHPDMLKRGAMTPPVERDLAPPPVRFRRPIEVIAEEVAAKHQVTVEALRGPSRQPAIVAARQEAFWRASQVLKADGRPRYCGPAIGLFFGGRHHTTVLHGVRRHEQRMGVGS